MARNNSVLVHDAGPVGSFPEIWKNQHMGTHFLSQFSLESGKRIATPLPTEEVLDGEGRPEANFSIPSSYVQKASLVRKLLQKMSGMTNLNNSYVHIQLIK